MFGYKNKKESGGIVVNGNHVGSTMQCVHCGRHCTVIAGSGKKRGWCRKCNGFVCGLSQCMNQCIPFESRVEYVEAVSEGNNEVINKLSTKYPQIKFLR